MGGVNYKLKVVLNEGIRTVYRFFRCNLFTPHHLPLRFVPATGQLVLQIWFKMREEEEERTPPSPRASLNNSAPWGWVPPPPPPPTIPP